MLVAEQELMLSNGDRLIPVTVVPAGKKLGLRCKYDYNLVTEFKCMRGARWNPDATQWEVTDCRRNWIQLESLQVDEKGEYRVPAEFARLREPLKMEPPTRDCAMPHQVHTFRHGYTYRCGIWAEEQGVGKSLAAIMLMEKVQGNWWYVAPLKVLRAFELELEKWKCAVKPRMLNYDILDRETEPHFQCRSCGEPGVPERRTWQKAKAIKHAMSCGPLDPESGKCTACDWYLGQVEEAHPRCQACGSVTATHGALWHEEAPFECPDGVIFDESSRLKNGGSNRAQAAQRLADRIRAERDGWVIEMTGTPAPHDICDWHSQAEIACPGLLRESTRAHLERRCAIIEQKEIGDGRTFGDIIGWKEDEAENLRRRLAPITLVYLSKDVLELPELVKEVIELPVAEDMRRAARLAAESASCAAQALNRLRQLSDGFQYGGVAECPVCKGMEYECPKCDGIGFLPTEGVRRAPGPKDDRLRYDLGLNEEVGRLVIYAGYRASIDRCVELCQEEGWHVLRCDGRGWDSELFAEGFGELDLLREMDLATRTDRIEQLAVVAHPKSGGLGQNWTAPRENIFFSNDFDAEARWQAEKRTHRNGQTRGVRIKDYSHLPTDAFVLRNLEAKRAWQSITLGEIVACL